MTLVQTIDVARDLLNEPLSAGRTFPDDTSSYWADSTLMTYHNIIQQEIASEMQMVNEDYFITSTSISIVAGTAAYNLPSDFVEMRLVEDVRTSTPKEIYPTTLNDRQGGDAFFVSGTFHGASYYIRGTQIVFDETPTYTQASAVTLHYIKRIPDVSAGSDSSEIPAQYHRVVSYGIAMMGLYQQQSENNFAKDEYQKGLVKLREYADKRQTQMSRKVKRVK